MEEQFKPSLTPREIFIRGSFGGTYWRPIVDLHGKLLENDYKLYKELKNIPATLMTLPYNRYDESINRYKRKVGTTLEYWRDKGWIKKEYPDQRGWVEWYVNYDNGRRIPGYDEYQIRRWIDIKKRFGNRLINLTKQGKDSLSIRQTLQHWAIDPEKIAPLGL